MIYLKGQWNGGERLAWTGQAYFPAKGGLG